MRAVLCCAVLCCAVLCAVQCLHSPCREPLMHPRCLYTAPYPGVFILPLTQVSVIPPLTQVEFEASGPNDWDDELDDFTSEVASRYRD